MKVRRSLLYIFSVILILVFVVLIVWYPINVLDKNSSLHKIILSNSLLFMQIFVLIRAVFVPIFVLTDTEVKYNRRVFGNMRIFKNNITNLVIGDGIKKSKLMSRNTSVFFYNSDIRKSQRKHFENEINKVITSNRVTELP